MKYEKLFSEGKIGPLTLKNRGIMMPMATDMADKDGIVTPRQIRYYQERAKGGLAMIIHEYTGVDDIDSIPSIHNLRAARDYHISPLEELTDAVHMYDCKIIAQIHHGGATSNPNFTGRQNLAPSAVPIADGRPVPAAMTLEDIKRVQQKFIDAAVRCKKAGYDGVELHGAHGYLIAQFFSKYYNRRTDEYGGSVENRCRFLTEIITGIRAVLGSFPILVRMCGDEMTPVEGFLSLEEGIEIAKHLETFSIDAINISNGSARNGDANCEPFSYQPGWKKHVAKAYKEALSIPVIATNTIKDPAFAEELLREGVCDFVGLGRSQLADPAFMNKAYAGHDSEIRKCIGCLYCRERVLGGGLPIRCSLNARTAREIEFDQIRRNGNGRTVCVIGAGPAGLEAAILLAERGFHPVVLEKEDHIGGTMAIADKPPLKDKITRFIETQGALAEKAGVEIRLNTEADTDVIAELDPAAVLVCCGAKPIVPAIPGADGPNVCLAEDVILGRAVEKGRVCVIGSGLTGLETAEMLLAQGHEEVAVVEMLPEIAPGIFPAIKNDELSRLAKAELLPGNQLTEIGEGSIVLKKADGSTVSKPCDTVILALGVRPDAGLVTSLKTALPGIPVRVCGDARKAGRIATAVREGYEAAYTLDI